MNPNISADIFSDFIYLISDIHQAEIGEMRMIRIIEKRDLKNKKKKTKKEKIYFN